MGRVLLSCQGDTHHDGGKCLGDCSSECNAEDAPTEEHYEHKIQHNVGSAADEQKVQRTFGVTLGTQDRCAKVVDQAEESTGKIYAHIEYAQVDDICRR